MRRLLAAGLFVLAALPAAPASAWPEIPPDAAQLNRTADNAASAETAIRLYSQSLQLFSSNGPALYGLGRALLEVDRPADSLKVFRRLDALFPNDPATSDKKLFLDLPNPYDYLVQAKASLKGGGYLGMLVPTVNQVERCLQALQHHQFAFVEVCEILLRYYKTDWDRLRPVDRMIAHTGYLLFGRSVDRLDALEEPEEVEGNGGEL